MKANPSVAEFVAQKIEASAKSQAQIAKEVGYDRPNVVSMIKSGNCKLPVGKIGAFAKALEVDPAFLFRLVMLEYSPETWRAIEEMEAAPITENERAIVAEIRQLSGDSDPKLQAPAHHRALKAFVNSMIG